MAKRRMFSLDIIDTDLFQEMPQTSRLLYYELCMRADDDGFVGSPKKIQKMVGCNDDDFRVLIAKQFVIPFETGVVVIKHWKIHNYIRTDRYKETIYREEKNKLQQEDNGMYTVGIPNVNQRYTQVRLGKVSIGKSNIYIDEPKTEKKVFCKPTIEEVKAYCDERHNNIDAQHFIDYYESNGWKVGKNSMKNWKAAVRTWEQRSKPTQTKNHTAREYTDSEYNDLYAN